MAAIGKRAIEKIILRRSWPGSKPRNWRVTHSSMMCRNFSVSSIPVRFPVLFTAIACLAVCSWLVRWKRALSVLRFRSRARWSVQYCENSSASRGNVFRGRKQSKEHDYISEFTLTNRPKSVCRFCEDIANVRHLFIFCR